MTWIHVLIAGLDLYLLISLGPWIALQFVEWLLHRPQNLLASARERLQTLHETERMQRALWPEEPRPGRYHDPDRVAQEQLAALHETIAQARKLEPTLSEYFPLALNLLDILCLRSWRPLRQALAAYRDSRALQVLLDAVDDNLSVLKEQQRIGQDIPSQARAHLNETRAEVARLTAILETEQQAGTAGLEQMREQLEATNAEAEAALAALSQAQPSETPLVVYEIDQFFELAKPSIEEMDRYLTQVIAERSRAQNLVARIESSLKLAEERWGGLKSRGAKEPTLENELPALWSSVAGPMSLVKERTLAAYQRILEEAASIQTRIERFMNQLDALEEAMTRSKEAVTGDVQLLGQAQAIYDDLAAQTPTLEANQSRDLIEKAAESYAEAERQRAQGTLESYHTAIIAAETAMKLLSEAQEGLAALPEMASEARQLLDALSANTLDDWRNRTFRVREQLQVYSQHWNAGLAKSAEETTSQLDQVEKNLEQLAPDIHYQRRFLQSELPKALEILSRARDSGEQAEAMIAALENEVERLNRARHDLEDALQELGSEDLPETRRLSQYMLPELKDRLDALEAHLQQQSTALQDPSQVNYDEALGEWLPRIRQELKELRLEHANSLRRYGLALEDAIRRIDRQWTRLERLGPEDPPIAEQDIEQLEADVTAWKEEAERATESPLLLRDLLGRRVAALEERIEAIQSQIKEGRDQLESLAREYRQHAQATHALRDKIRQMLSESEWDHIDWSIEESERAWEDAVKQERASHSAQDLASASDQLQRAVNAAERAEQLHSRTEHQVSSALTRLDEELYEVVSALERCERRADQLGERGMPEEAIKIEALCRRAERNVEMAKSATTFEDALAYLRESKEILSRI
ncbi:MAG: hypothetical protein A2Y73_08650 [Chloroflexi bacterium RBG_13_56_8]|nr:MAG: hypothetical protein A2Y73_08650 [Chloroflexi bacterium RBG_13_56_8]